MAVEHSTFNITRSRDACVAVVNLEMATQAPRLRVMIALALQ